MLKKIADAGEMLECPSNGNPDRSQMLSQVQESQAQESQAESQAENQAHESPVYKRIQNASAPEQNRQEE